MTDIDDGAAPYEVGQRESISHKVTQGEILAFAELSGDDNPMHVDEGYVRSRGYGGLVSHGILTAALVSRVIGTRLPGHGALWTSQDLEFSGVVQPGDVITAEVEVKRVVPKDNLLILDAEVRNQQGDVVLRGRGRVHYSPTAAEDSASVDVIAPGRALVLGASGSIGRAICAALLEAGFECLAVFRDSRTLWNRCGAACRRNRATTCGSWRPTSRPRPAGPGCSNTWGSPKSILLSWSAPPVPRRTAAQSNRWARSLSSRRSRSICCRWSSWFASWLPP